jgi:hypothetical protein
MGDIPVQYLLLMHSCVASSLLFAIFSYQIREQKSRVTLTAGFPFFLFNIAWVFAIITILFSSHGMFLYCLGITALAIFATFFLLLAGLIKGLFI